MRDAFTTIWANPYVRVAVGLLVAAVLVVLFVATQPAGALFLTALGLAYLMNPLVDLLQRHRVRRPFSVALIATALVVSLGLLSQYAVGTIGTIVTEGEDGLTLAETVPEFFLSLPDRIEALLPERVRGTARAPLDALDRSIEGVDERLVPYLEQLTVGTYGFLRGTVSQVVNAVLVLILTVYVLIDFERISASRWGAVPRPYLEPVRSLAGTLDRVTGAYVRGQLLIAGLVGLMVFVGLTLVGLPGAGVIGLLAGILNVVPFIGSVVPIIPAVLIAIGGGWVQVILVLVVFAVANQIDTHALTPLVLSRSTELHPVTVMLAVVGGFALGGLVTAILAVPAVAFLKALYEEYYPRSGFYRSG
jgi:predicted PurR-regulated permease PerM